MRQIKQLNKFFLDMSKAKLLARSIVLIDDTRLEPNQYYQIKKNIFSELANPLVLKSLLKAPVSEKPASSEVNREFICDSYNIIYGAIPPKFQIIDNDPENENKIVKLAKEMVKFANIEGLINKVGVNYEMFLESDKDIKDYLLKDSIAAEFTSLSATPVFKIDEETTLNLTLASAENDKKKGIYFRINFDNKITEENTFDKILDKKLKEIAENKIKSIIG